VTDEVHDMGGVEAEAEAELEAEAGLGVPETGIEELDADLEDPDADVEEPDTDVEEPDRDLEDPDTDLEDPDTDLEDQTPAPVKRSRLRRPRMPRALRVLGNSRIVAAALAVLLLISGGAASWIYFKQYRPDEQTDPSVRQAVASSASDGTTALLSYSADTLDQDFASAKSHLAGEFLSYYVQFTQEKVGPAARERSMKTTARVTGAAVSELHPDSAVVLVFVDQTTTTKDSPQPALVISNVRVTMTLIKDKWLITKFTPI
jgi:Mce-associated membrane protein